MSTPVSHPAQVAQPRTGRIARLLASNDPPLDIEEQTYRVIVTQGQNRLIQIDEQIMHIRAALESLILQRDQLHEIDGWTLPKFCPGPVQSPPFEHPSRARIWIERYCGTRFSPSRFAGGCLAYLSL